MLCMIYITFLSYAWLIFAKAITRLLWCRGRFSQLSKLAELVSVLKPSECELTVDGDRNRVAEFDVSGFLCGKILSYLRVTLIVALNAGCWSAVAINVAETGKVQDAWLSILLTKTMVGRVRGVLVDLSCWPNPWYM